MFPYAKERERNKGKIPCMQRGPTSRSTSRMYALSAVELSVRGRWGRQVLSARPGKQDKKAAGKSDLGQRNRKDTA